MTEMEQQLAAAAAKRAKEIATRADRPRERRSAPAPGARAAMRAKAKIELRAATDGATLDFHGCASAYEAPYEMWDYWGPYTEIVTAGAGAQSLANPELDVPLVLQHASLRRIARTTNGSLTLSEGETDDGGQGLIVAAPKLDRADQDVAYIEPKIRSGLIDEMSFMFTITSGQWDPSYTEYRINGYDIHRGDVSIVGYGANPTTSATLRAAASVFGKLQVGRALDAEDVNMLTQALGWLSAIDNIVDEGQEALAAYLQVPNPDADEAVEQLEAMGPDQLRVLERAIRRELNARQIAPAMSLQDLLAIGD